VWMTGGLYYARTALGRNVAAFDHSSFILPATGCRTKRDLTAITSSGTRIKSLMSVDSL
jgi:hypothetical protein